MSSPGDQVIGTRGKYDAVCVWNSVETCENGDIIFECIGQDV